MHIADYEVPVARSMIAMALHLGRRRVRPVEAFTCYRAAFNNIYIVVAERRGKTLRFRKNRDGSIRTRAVGQVKVPEVDSRRGSGCR